MRKTCEVCGRPFEARRAAAKFCGARCRQRAHRRPKGSAASGIHASSAELASDLADVTVAEATAAELRRAGRVQTAAGQAALVLARRIDSGLAETGSALAALAREHRAALADAVKDASKEADPLDELRARRERKLAGG